MQSTSMKYIIVLQMWLMLEKNCQIQQIYDAILKRQNSIMYSQYGAQNLW